MECRRAIVFLSVLGIAGLGLRAHVLDSSGITWSRDVSRIVYKNCVSCHHEGGSAASLITYEQARLSAEAIKQQVLSRRMPPWNAVEGFGEFKNDRGLTQEDIEIIAEWVEGGAREGNPIYLPPQPDSYASASQHDSGGKALRIAGTGSMKHSIDAVGIKPRRVPASGVLQVIARRPDGSIEPLLWIEKFNSGYDGTYYFRRPLPLPAGTRVDVMPASGEVFLFVKRSQTNSER